MNERLKFFGDYSGRTPFYIELAGITYPDPSYRITRSCSDIAVIEYITEGEGYVCHKGRTHHVCKDMIYFLPQGEDHEYYADRENPFEKIFLNVSGSYCLQLVSAYGLSGKHFFSDYGLKNVFERIPEIIVSSISDSEIQSALQGIFIEIMARLSLARERATHSEEALKLKNHLDTNLNRIVSSKELSQIIFRSPDYCLKLFNREFGITPYAYQLERKMQMAKSLLTDTNLSVGEIAESLGYCDLHYFSNLFYNKMGCRPLNCRKNNR